MKERYIECRYEYFVDKPTSTWIMIGGFILTIVILISGFILNTKFVKKLQDEKRRRPLGRKGNVIEPLMIIFCNFQMMYWPFDLMFMWVNTNGIISSKQMPTWLLYFFYEPIRYGRTYLACNSLFIALIRYVYIVHLKKMNQYEFKNVAKLFQMLSIVLPFSIEIASTFTFSANFCKWKMLDDSPVKFGNAEEFAQKETVEWAMKYLPKQVISSIALLYVTAKVLIVSKFVEVFLYLRTFKEIERYDIIKSILILYYL